MKPWFLVFSVKKEERIQSSHSLLCSELVLLTDTVILHDIRSTDPMGRSTNVHFTIPKQVQRSATSFNVLGEWRGGGDTSIPLCKAGEIFDSQYGFKVAR
jgi:hypothetical protein